MKSNSIIFFICLFILRPPYSLGMNPLRQAILNQTNRDVAKSLFLSYTPEQKVSVWYDKITQTIFIGGWSTQQLAMLELMKTRLKPMIFFNGSSEQKKFDDFYNTFEVDGIKLFGKENYAKILITLEDYNHNAPTAGDPSGADCGCCMKCTFTCDWLTGSSSCAKSTCSGSKRGCGGLWNQVCDGECNLFSAYPGNDIK